MLVIFTNTTLHFISPISQHSSWSFCAASISYIGMYFISAISQHPSWPGCIASIFTELAIIHPIASNISGCVWVIIDGGDIDTPNLIRCSELNTEIQSSSDIIRYIYIYIYIKCQDYVYYTYVTRSIEHTYIMVKLTHKQLTKAYGAYSALWVLMTWTWRILSSWYVLGFLSALHYWLPGKPSTTAVFQYKGPLGRYRDDHGRLFSILVILFW